MKLTVVLLMVSSVVVVYSLADPAPQSRGKPRFKSQLRSRTGTAAEIENKPKSEFLRESIRTPARESIRTPIRESIRNPARESIRTPARESIRTPARESIRTPARDFKKPPTTTPTPTPTTTTESIIIPEDTTSKPEPKPRAIENNLIETNSVTEFPSYANATAPVPVADCQQNDLLNKLLLRVLLSSMMSTTTQNPLMENLNRLFNINPTPASSPTTVVTSTVISTITQLFSTIVSVMFRNQKLPTTIFSSSTLVVTEFQTITSTLGSHESSPFRFKREASIENDLQVQSSLDEPNSPAKQIQPTQPLSPTVVANLPESVLLPTIDIDRLIDALNQPEIQEAWTQFLKVLNRVLE